MSNLNNLLRSIGNQLQQHGQAKGPGQSGSLQASGMGSGGGMNFAALAAGGAGSGGVQTQGSAPQQANQGSNLISGASTAAMSSGNPYLMAAGAAVKFGVALTESFDKIRTFTDGLNQTNLKFSTFSASMAAVQARFESRDFLTKMGQGDSRAESAGRLADSQNELDKASAATEDRYHNTMNELGIQLNHSLTGLIGIWKKFMEWIGNPYEPPSDAEDTPLGEWVKEMAEFKKDAESRRPEGMGRRGG